MQAPRQPSPNMTLRDLTLWAQAAHRYMMSLSISGSPGISVNQSPRGCTISIKKSQPVRNKGGAAPAAVVYPFAIEDATDRSTPSTPIAKVTVGWGTIENYVPTMDGDSLTLGNPHTFSAAGTYVGYIDFTGGGATIGWVDIGSTPVPSDDSTHTYCVIGQVKVVVDGSGYSISVPDIEQGVFNSFKVRYCSGSVWFWTALAVP